jgi:hypothetical protein
MSQLNERTSRRRACFFALRNAKTAWPTPVRRAESSCSPGLTIEEAPFLSPLTTNPRCKSRPVPPWTSGKTGQSAETPATSCGASCGPDSL